MLIRRSTFFSNPNQSFLLRSPQGGIPGSGTDGRNSMLMQKMVVASPQRELGLPIAHCRLAMRRPLWEVTNSRGNDVSAHSRCSGQALKVGATAGSETGLRRIKMLKRRSIRLCV